MDARPTTDPKTPRFSRKQLALAFAVAAVADGFLFFVKFTPLQWVADLVTSLLLFMVLGWQWILLPGLIMEAIPGLNVLPYWVLVVAVVAIWGTRRPSLRSLLRDGVAQLRG